MGAEGARRLRRSLVSSVALSGLAAAWILTRASPLTLNGDAEMLQHPLLVDAARQLFAGRLPLWTTGRWGGSPLIGDPVVGALYPPYYLSYLLVPFPHWRALDVSTCLHLALLATGMACLLHRLGAGPAAAVATAGMAVLSPTFVYAARGWQQYWAALSYWPWLFWAAAGLVAVPSVRLALVAAVALAAQVYAGYPEFALYSGLPALTWIVLARGGLRRIPLTLVIGLGSIALALPQVLPGLEMARESIRFTPGAVERMAALDEYFALSGRSWLDAVRTTPLSALAIAKLAPGAVVLAAVGALRRDFPSRFLAVVALGAGCLATGPNVLYRTVRVIPPFSFFGAPVKLFFPANFLVVVLAGLGLARLAGAAVRWQRLFVAVVGVGLAATLATTPTGIALLAAPALLAATAPPPALPWAAAGIAFAGSLGFLVASHALDARLPFVPPVFIQLLRTPPAVGPRDGARLLALDQDRTLHQVGLNVGALWGAEAWNGMADLAQWRQAGVMENAVPGTAAALVRQVGADPVVVAERNALAGELAAAGFTTVGRADGMLFLAPPGPPVPRVQLVPHADAVSADAAVAAARVGQALDERHVLIEAETLPGGADGDPDGRLDVLEHEPGTVHVRVALARPTWLVMREPYYRNWHATVDARPVQTFPAGGFLLAALIDGGQHDVRLVYREPRLLVGVVGMVLAALLLPVALRRAIGRPGPTS